MKGTGRLTDDLAAYLRDRIISGEIAGGTALAEANLAHEYDVARPTARAAIEILARDGLVQRKPNVPAVVSTITSEELPEILALLETSEMIALDLILENDPDLRPLRRELAHSTYSLLDQLVQASGSERLASLHRRLTYELILARVNQPIQIVDDGGERHELVASLLQQDADAARAALTSIQGMRKESLGAIKAAHEHPR
ncbi:MAG: GntR family transcriptional regulator [Actinomycetaceae bacterium]|nr:GntR family transcriptional regulator [Arcanobacterium sp.]MDD7504917.1 GntR family transcriptional regulator [Actinomycetaceae bacterium]MDY6143263.1 GntR family transcriptional regulator [Arcanobacterium sp.]